MVRHYHAERGNEIQKKQLRIGGLTPLTTIDYPHTLSCVIYCQGCSWRCRYCHNPDMLVTNRESTHDWAKILKFLERRKGLLEAVVFSGGEPLTQKHLLSSIQQVKNLGFKIGLHTAGALPKRLNQVLPLVDWVGFDVKDIPEYVDSITQVKGSGENNWQSLQLLVDSGVKFQCRTTVHWQLIDTKRLIKLTQRLVDLGISDYVIQFSRTETMLDPDLGYSVLAPERIQQLKNILIEIMPSLSWV